MVKNFSDKLIDEYYEAKIKIPYHLRELVNNQKEIAFAFAEANPTVRLALNLLIGEYPQIKSSILDDRGEISKFLSVYLNDSNIKFVNSLDTRLNGDENILSIRAALAGG